LTTGLLRLEAAYSAAKIELIPTGGSSFHARVVLLRLDWLWVQPVYESAPRILGGTIAATRLLGSTRTLGLVGR